MAAPTITRPPASVADEPKSAAIPPEWAVYIKWTLVGAFAAALVALAVALVTSMSESSRTAKARSQWDELYASLKDVNRDEDRIEPLEKLAESDKLKGTAVHGFILTQLGNLHFKLAQNDKSSPEERNAALKRAQQIFEMLATTSPFKENMLFGPAAVRNLAQVYEQAALSDKDSVQSYDSAVKSLRGALFQGEGKDAPAVATMQAHYLFNPMQAQLGRLYWMRGVRSREIAQQKADDEKKKAAPPKTEAKPGDKPEAKKEEKKEEPAPIDESIGKADFALAQYYLSQALLATPSAEEAASGKAAWRTEASFILSLLKDPGSLLKDGKAPAVREEKKEEPKVVEKKDEPKPAVTKPAEEKKPETKPVEKKDEPKKEEPKKEEKKSSSAESNDSGSLADEPSLPAQHLTYAQMQQLLKQGKPAFCQCPRCVNGDKSIGAKLSE
jgi:hypothetical protein